MATFAPRSAELVNGTYLASEAGMPLGTRDATPETRVPFERDGARDDTNVPQATQMPGARYEGPPGLWPTFDRDAWTDRPDVPPWMVGLDGPHSIIASFYKPGIRNLGGLKSLPGTDSDDAIDMIPPDVQHPTAYPARALSAAQSEPGGMGDFQYVPAVFVGAAPFG